MTLLAHAYPLLLHRECSPVRFPPGATKSPLVRVTIKDSPTTHLHPVEYIRYNDDEPIEIGCNNDQYDMDQGGHIGAT